MNILVVDNYDSFTFNLVQALGELGAHPGVRRNDDVDVAGIRDVAPQAIVISPGPKTPGEAGASVAIVEHFSGEIPILGVCLGHQAIAVAFGARVVARRPVMHGKTSRIRHDGQGLFEGLPDPLEVARYHSLIVEPESLPSALLPTATTDDGIVMAIRHAEHPTFGVQFHPESYLTRDGLPLLQNFLRMSSCPISMPTA